MSATASGDGIGASGVIYFSSDIENAIYKVTKNSRGAYLRKAVPGRGRAVACHRAGVHLLARANKRPAFRERKTPLCATTLTALHIMRQPRTISILKSRVQTASP